MLQHTAGKVAGMTVLLILDELARWVVEADRIVAF